MPPHFDWPLIAPIRILAKAQHFDEWMDAQVLPSSPITREESKGLLVELVPYGSTKQFRVSMFPVIEQFAPKRAFIKQFRRTLSGNQLAQAPSIFRSSK